MDLPEIVPLTEAEWKDCPVPMRYTTEEYYDLETEHTVDGWTVGLKKKHFSSPVTHTPEEYDFPDRLFEDYRPQAQAWGVVSESGELRACIETFPEEWSNRLIVSEMWVAEDLRRRGLGHALMDLAKERMRREKRRALILETQSCNVGAIAFYLSEGFSLIGFDSCCYTNRDRERCEVRLDLGFFPDGEN